MTASALRIDRLPGNVACNPSQRCLTWPSAPVLSVGAGKAGGIWRAAPLSPVLLDRIVNWDRDNAECELWGLEFTDGSQWSNENLGAGDRPRGGFSDAELARRDVETVRIEITDLERGMLRFTSLTDAPIRSVHFAMNVYDQDGRVADQVQLPESFGTLAPHESRDMLLKDATPLHGKPASSLELLAYSTELTDGTWIENLNLLSKLRRRPR